MKTRFLVMAIGLVLVASAAFGQPTNGTLSGNVSSGGSGLPGATVTATSPSITGARTAMTDTAGNYTLPDLPPGDYAVTFELSGLQTLTRHVLVAAGQAARLDADLAARKGAVAEEMTVTGTLIPRPTLEAMSPVATLDVDALNYQGTTRLEDFLTNLPQVFSAQNSTIANGASGTATVDLRQMGSARTLVLIDGLRMPPGDGLDIAPDLNFIPAALVKRVDVLTGGASSVYGADAVAGVVNFVLDHEFEGLRAGLSGGGYQHNNNNGLAKRINTARGYTVPTGSVADGGQFEAFAAYGSKFADNKGHGSLYIDYRKTAALKKDRRDYTNCSVTGLSLSGPSCGGSSTAAGGRFLTDDGGDYTLDSSGAGFRNFTSADVFNFATYNYMQRPDQKWSAGGFLNYEWNRFAQGYASVMMMDDQTDAQIAPSGNFFVTDHINCDNPMLSADQRQKICTNAGYGPDDMAGLFIGRRNVEGGGRIDRLSHQSYRLVGGVKGDINDVWNYDVYGLHGQTRVPEQYLNDLNSQRLQQALLVTGNPNDPSTWQCMDATARGEGCVPWNVFKKGGVTQAALDYLRIPLLSNANVKTEVLSATARADLKKYGLALPSATEGLSLAIGADYMKFGLNFQSDLAYQLGIGAGQGGAIMPVNGSYDVKELYTELLLPLVQNAPGARDLSLELGYRTSDYSTTGRYPTYKAQVSYAPTADFKVRGGYNRATRSPNIIELFTPQSLGLNGTQDICAGTSPSATLEQCKRTGVTDAQYGHILENPAEQYNSFDGGNPNLNPEIADTTTFGLVITPQAMPTFNAAFDYYNIKIKDRIDAFLPDQVISACADTGDPFLCGLIHRDARGTLWLTPDAYTMVTNFNIGELRGEGVDVNVNYMKPFGSNSLTLGLMGTYMIKNFTDTGLYAYDCVGYYGDQCGQPNSKWQHLFHVGFQRGNTGVTLGWRMVGQVTVDAASSARGISDPGSIPLYKANGSYENPAFHYLDLAATYDFTNKAHFTVGINNVADKEPPMGVGFSGNDYGTGWYGAYDPYGRYLHASVSFNLK